MALGNIYYFNPTCELAVANGSFSYQPPSLLQEMERELAILPFVFCSENDFVLSENQPNEIFLQQLKRVGFDLPHFCSLAELEAMPAGSFNKIIPWGWSPAAHHKLSRLKEKCSPEFKKSPVYNWQSVHKTLYERATSLSFLHKILVSETDDCLINRELTGIKVYNLEEIELLLRNHNQLVIKAPLSSSGRGIQMIRKQELDKARIQWISGVFKHQGYIVAEPLLEKVMDFSFQFRIKSPAEIEYLGISFFETNSNGQYLRTFVNPDPVVLFRQKADFYIVEKINAVAQILKNELFNSLYSNHYRGWIGIDAMLFNNNGRLFIHPCVEINCRMNMGILAKLLEDRIDSGNSGKFELFYGLPGQFKSFIHNKTYTEPVILKNGKIYSGIIPLTERNSKTKFGAYLSVGEPRY